MTAYLEVSELRDEVVLCRMLGHSWDDNPTANVDSELYRHSRAVLALRCTRCTTERFDYIDHNFLVGTRYYRYPDGYKSIPGQGTRPNLRREAIGRSLFARSYRARNGKVRR